MSVLPRPRTVTVIAMALVLGAGAPASAAPSVLAPAVTTKAPDYGTDAQSYFCGFWKIKWC